MLELKITGGQLLDGTGAPAVRADLGLAGGRVAALGDLSAAAAAEDISAAGLLVCPGFIDVHSHSDAFLLVEPAAPSKICQGITTEVVGNCGASAAPLAAPCWLPADWRAQTYPGAWKTMAAYLALLEQVRPAPNVAALVGHGRLRDWVLGRAARPAQPDELRVMQRLLEASLDAGAWGLSSGLIYPPGKWADTAELAALAQTAAAAGGIYTTHLRSEGAALAAAVDEALATARASGARLQISHLKTAGRRNWHRLEAVLETINRARDGGLPVAADRYPYLASCTDLDVVLPDWAVAGGPDEVLERLRDPACRERLQAELFAGDRSPADVVIGSTGRAELRGQPLPAVAASLGLEPAAAVLDLLLADGLQTSAFFLGMSGDNLRRILAEPWVMVGSDASLRAPTGPLSRDFPHPRAYGAFPRFLRLVQDENIMSWPEAVRRLTSLPAEHFGLRDRGRLAPGCAADVVVLDPAAVRDRATFAEPHQLAAGIVWVLVNGVVTLTPAGLSGRRGGQVLRR